MSIIINGMNMPKGNRTKNLLIYSNGIVFTGHKDDSNYTAEERKTGKWIDKEVVDDRKDAKIQQWQQARCSCCNKWHTTPYMYYFKNYDYCPSCGADMREGQE